MAAPTSFGSEDFGEDVGAFDEEAAIAWASSRADRHLLYVEYYDSLGESPGKLRGTHRRIGTRNGIRPPKRQAAGQREAVRSWSTSSSNRARERRETLAEELLKLGGVSVHGKATPRRQPAQGRRARPRPSPEQRFQRPQFSRVVGAP
jgi:hypothetical protein